MGTSSASLLRPRLGPAVIGFSGGLARPFGASLAAVLVFLPFKVAACHRNCCCVPARAALRGPTAPACLPACWAVLCCACLPALHATSPLPADSGEARRLGLVRLAALRTLGPCAVHTGHSLALLSDLATACLQVAPQQFPLPAALAPFQQGVWLWCPLVLNLASLLMAFGRGPRAAGRDEAWHRALLKVGGVKWGCAPG